MCRKVRRTYAKDEEGASEKFIDLRVICKSFGNSFNFQNSNMEDKTHNGSRLLYGTQICAPHLSQHFKPLVLNNVLTTNFWVTDLIVQWAAKTSQKICCTSGNNMQFHDTFFTRSWQNMFFRVLLMRRGLKSWNTKNFMKYLCIRT